MPRVLLVDDEPNIRWTMAELLKREGFEADTARDFDSALTIIENNEVDVALVDIVLPLKDGIEILKALHGREPYVPVIMMTGEPNVSRMPEIVRAGAYDFLPKPVTRDALISAVSRAVEKKRLMDDKRTLERQVKRYTDQMEQAVAERTNELLEAHNFLNTVLDSSTGYALIAVDTGGQITLFNLGAELMFGHSANDAIGRPVREMLGGGDEPTNWPLLESAGPAGSIDRYQAELDLLRKDGSAFPASVTTTPIRNHDSQSFGYLGIIKDLTEQRQNEERFRQMQARLAHNEKIAALGRMAAQVAHEVKNPLAGLRLYALYLKGKIAGKIPLAEEALVDKIIDVIDRLSDTAEQVLSFARPVTLTRRRVDLNRIITDCVPLLEPQTNAKQITIELSFGQPKAFALLDEAAMRSTLVNLMLNSIQAMRTKGVLRVSTETANDGLRLAVIDNGCGMTEEQVTNMFEPFYTTKSKGLGLGMSFASKIIERHGGSIAVDSRLEEGTSITILLPATAPVRQAASLSEQEREEAREASA